ncbi:MAG: serine hydroxymethyltransferase [Methanocellales archaeon]
MRKRKTVYRDENVRYIINAIKEHHRLFSTSLPMIASENITSPTARLVLLSDLSHRYAEGKVSNRFYQGCKYIDKIEERTIELAKELFQAEHVNIQPISGVNANIAAFFALAKPGDLLMALTVPHGGHVSHTEYSAAGIRGLRFTPHPFDDKIMNIDSKKMVEKIKLEKPNLIVFGGSLFLFPHPVKEAREAADEVGAKIVYDAAHVLGLIAGGKFQDPLGEGADVVTSSSHKTFPGPQGGMILCKKEFADDIDRAVFPGTTSNHHLHHVAALAITLAEMKKFAKPYARQTIANAKALARALYEKGFDVCCPELDFTESHQVAIDVSKLGDASKLAIELEKANIIVNKNLLPKDYISKTKNPSGIRLGSQELTRLGMKEGEMREIADFFKRLLIDKEKPEKIREEVIEFRRGYQKVHYCFTHEFEAYEFPSF